MSAIHQSCAQVGASRVAVLGGLRDGLVDVLLAERSMECRSLWWERHGGLPRDAAAAWLGGASARGRGLEDLDGCRRLRQPGGLVEGADVGAGRCCLGCRGVGCVCHAVGVAADGVVAGGRRRCRDDRRWVSVRRRRAG
eukprot:6306042-Alexandrium_andersonii.AAC.1